MCVFKLYGNTEFLSDDVQRFLHHLKADLCAAFQQRRINKGLSNSSLPIIGLIKQINENVAVDKIIAHSFLLG